MTQPIIKVIEVGCPAAEAFTVFVENTSRWWPLDKHSVSAGAGKTARAVTIEPRLGGAVYETKFDGSRSEWGEVLVFEQGKKLAMSWHPGTNSDTPTRVDVAFEDLSEGRAKVTLIHSGWAIWSDKADEMRGGYNSGWDIVFGERFASACGAANPV